MSGYEGFVDLKYKPSSDDLICSFYMEPADGVNRKIAAGAVAGESSVGTWTELTTMTKRIQNIGARCFEIKGNWIKIAYPSILFEEGNMPQILSSVAGNIFGMKIIKNLKLYDIVFPNKLLKSFKGPKFGIKGIRKIFGVYNRPLTVVVPKPKIGMTSAEHARVGYQIWTGGIDLLKDDENLSNQTFNKFKKRLELSLRMRDKAERETGEKKSYLVNITSESREMIKRAKLVKDYGNEYVMVDIVTVGWSALQTIRDVAGDLNLAIHAHRAMHAAFDRNPKHGISMLVLAKLARIVGVDQLHTGTANIGKLESGENETQNINKFLHEKLGNMKTVLPVSSGGLHPGSVEAVIKTLGKDIAIQAGGGTLGHPMGPQAGAKAMRQAIDASIRGISLKDYARNHKELRMALEKWGYIRKIKSKYPLHKHLKEHGL